MSAPAATPKKAASAKPKAKKVAAVATHPKYPAMIAAAIGSLKERGGSSRQAILKYIQKQYNFGKNENVINMHLKVALRAGVKNGTLKQSKGCGATGSFRLSDKVAPKPKKVVAKKPKAAAAKKAKSPKKARKPKSPAKVKRSKSPVKAKKPKAAAKAKKPAVVKAKKTKTPVKAKKAAGRPKKAASKKA